jgi:hypothetical protein
VSCARHSDGLPRALAGEARDNRHAPGEGDPRRIARVFALVAEEQIGRRLEETRAAGAQLLASLTAGDRARSAP